MAYGPLHLQFAGISVAGNRLLDSFGGKADDRYSCLPGRQADNAARVAHENSGLRIESMAVNIFQTHLLGPEFLEQVTEFFKKDIKPFRQITLRASRQPDHSCLLKADGRCCHPDQAVAGDIQSGIDSDNPLSVASVIHGIGL